MAGSLKTQRVLFVAAIVIISTVAGGLLGVLAEVALYSKLDPTPTYTGMYAGLASGLFVALLYCGALACHKRNHAGMGTLYGLIAALASSTFVHMVLIERWPGSGFGPMFAGDLIALVVGLSLGAIGGNAYGKCCLQRPDLTSTEKEENSNA